MTGIAKGRSVPGPALTFDVTSSNTALIDAATVDHVDGESTGTSAFHAAGQCQWKLTF